MGEIGCSGRGACGVDPSIESALLMAPHHSFCAQAEIQEQTFNGWSKPVSAQYVRKTIFED
jgi:hypothetical protein